MEKCKLDVKNLPYIFVYGTLKLGGSNNHLLEGAEFISKVVTYEDYDLMNYGGFPCMSPESLEGNRVRGQLFRIQEQHLERMDRLEGHPDFYYRSVVEVVSEETAHIEYAWAYFHHNPDLPLCPVIEGAFEWN